MEISLVTSSQSKLKEIRSILRREINSVSLNIVEIQAVKVSEVVGKKQLSSV